jgi:rod shape-determining protein MreD
MRGIERAAPESRGRLMYMFFLFFLIGIFALVIQSAVPALFPMPIQWLLILIIYLGIYKSLGIGLFLTIILGLCFDFWSGGTFGEGLFSALFIFGLSRGISGTIYADRPLVQFLIIFGTLVGLFGCLSLLFSLSGVPVGSIKTLGTRVLLSSLLSAVVGTPLLWVCKAIDPQRGGYYLARFMEEEREEPLI